jgi:carbon monoxide dehydrogenase subunit G
VARFREYVRNLPQSALVLLLVGWSLGSLSGAFVGRMLAPERKAWPGLVVGMFFLVATVANLFMLSHVLWLNIAAPLSVFLFALLGLGLAAPREHVVRGSLAVRAPVGKVFRTLATAEEFSRAVPDIKKIEFLTDRHYGAGTRFRETRMMGSREAVAELSVRELVENDRVRITGDMMNTEWDTLFRVVPAADGTEVQLETTARPRGFLARLCVPMMLGMVRKAILGDLDAVRRHCEKAG